MKLKDLHKIEFPREKLEKYGQQKLADHELLAILLGSGIKGVNVLELSRKILSVVTKVGIQKVTLADLRAVKGLGNAKAAQVVAVLELGKRLTEERSPQVLSAEDAWKMCADIRDSKREHFAAFYLDTQHQLIERQIISVGTLNSSLVHPREVFEPAIRLHAANIIVAHNHPSGILAPSEEDRQITKRICAAGEIVGVSVLDHVIVSRTAYFSFEEEHLL